MEVSRKSLQYGKIHLIKFYIIFITQIIKHRKRVCGLETTTINAKTQDRSCMSMNDGLSGSKNTGNGKSRHETAKLLDKSHQSH